MVRITKSFLGEAAGKMGDVVFRQMNGKTFASLRPDKYKPTKSAKLKTARKNFAVTIGFAKNINALPALREIWRVAKLPGKLPFNRIVKSNRAYAADGVLTKRNIITPEGLFFDVNSISIKDKVLDISFSLPADYKLQYQLRLFLFFYFKESRKIILSQSVNIEEVNMGEDFNLNIPLDSEIKKALGKDPEPILYAALSGSPVRRKIYWTSTAAIEIG